MVGLLLTLLIGGAILFGLSALAWESLKKGTLLKDITSLLPEMVLFCAAPVTALIIAFIGASLPPSVQLFLGDGAKWLLIFSLIWIAGYLIRFFWRRKTGKDITKYEKHEYDANVG